MRCGEDKVEGRFAFAFASVGAELVALTLSVVTERKFEASSDLIPVLLLWAMLKPVEAPVEDPVIEPFAAQSTTPGVDAAAGEMVMPVSVSAKQAACEQLSRRKLFTMTWFNFITGLPHWSLS